MIDKSAIFRRPVIDVIVHFGRVNPQLEGWLAAVAAAEVDVRRHYSRYDVSLARRQCLANFLANDVSAGATHLVMIDEDMVPDGRSDGILTEPGDLVFCGFHGRCGRMGHYGDGDFGAAMCRISERVATAIQADSAFDLGMTADRLAIETCECRVFARQASKFGYRATMVGVVGHLVEMVAWPVGPGGCELNWPAGA